MWETTLDLKNKFTRTYTTRTTHSKISKARSTNQSKWTLPRNNIVTETYWYFFVQDEQRIKAFSNASGVWKGQTSNAATTQYGPRGPGSSRSTELNGPWQEKLALQQFPEDYRWQETLFWKWKNWSISAISRQWSDLIAEDTIAVPLQAARRQWPDQVETAHARVHTFCRDQKRQSQKYE